VQQAQNNMGERENPSSLNVSSPSRPSRALPETRATPRLSAAPLHELLNQEGDHSHDKDRDEDLCDAS